MKSHIAAILFIMSQASYGQETQNIFIITTDGFRWQEVFKGADPSLINNAEFVKDTALIKQLYWDIDINERRKKLMPFFWNTIAKDGQLYGNRQLNNKVNVKNIYKISYPGYNELFTGYADPIPVFNTPTLNKNINILEYLNDQPAYAGKVVAFSSWNILPFILNNKRNKMIQNSGYELLPVMLSDSTEISQVQQSISIKTKTRQDLLTYIVAKDYIQTNHPRVVLISLGQTDDFAHNGQYDMYLQNSNSIDKMIAELWYFVQTDPFYRNQTTFIITTDHGRGNRTKNWTKHNLLINGSGEIWMGLIGPGIKPIGEMTTKQKVFQHQLAATIAGLLGEKFQANHPVAGKINLPGSSMSKNIMGILTTIK